MALARTERLRWRRGVLSSGGVGGAGNTVPRLTISTCVEAKMATCELPSPEVLRQLLDYDPETGVLTWRERPVEFFRDTEGRTAEHACANWNSRYSGKPAFTSLTAGYPSGSIFKHSLYGHRVIWALMTGEWPEVIDHADGDKINNRWSNLRNGTQSDNMKNLPMRASNKSGHCGVFWDERRNAWIAYIGSNGRRYLGQFERYADAVSARVAAEKDLNFDPRHGRWQHGAT